MVILMIAEKFLVYINLFLPPVTGHQGFSISALFGKPNMRTLRRGERRSKQKTVHLICQKNQGDKNPPSQYLIINCQIVISRHWRSMTASIPDLTNFLSTYCTQVRFRFNQNQETFDYFKINA